ncbi:hypothetical protein PRUPE_2G047000 [Prunus persica]|uniref:Uncharacterized protein n=1 Tax=Prunus persica TaxID=3760 RepID=A0A251QB57_PRUPE|nr:hypothetical protein PRUPE_2G047000 [Prunus persica]
MPSHLIYSFARVGGMKTRKPVSRFSSSQGPDFRQESEAKRKLAFSSHLLERLSLSSGCGVLHDERASTTCNME